MRLLLAPLALLALAAPIDELAVTVEPGTKITKTFTNSLELELVEIQVMIGDDEIEIPEDEMPEVTITDEESIVFVDEYVSVKDGRPTEIVRTFETLEDVSTQTVVVPGQDEQEMSEEGESGLLGLGVRFTWDDETEEYAVAFQDEESDADVELLEDLDADADYRAFLPGKDVEVGASWEIDLLAFDRVSNPSGDLKIDKEGENEEDPEFGEKFRENLDGELEATLVEIEDGVAKISIAGKVTTSVDSEMAPEGGPEFTRTMAFRFECDGELLWDLELGTCRRMTLGGDVELEISTRPGDGTAMTQIQRFEGAFESTASFE